MSSKSVPGYSALLALGIVLVVTSLLSVGRFPKSVVGVCIGVGSGLVAMNAVCLAMYHYFRRHPDLEKQNRIDALDERTLAITARAKAKAFDILVVILAIFPLVLVLAGAPLWQALMPTAIYMLGFCMQLHYMGKFSREM